jgi:putative hydrolase of the HAD superfamily
MIKAVFLDLGNTLLNSYDNVEKELEFPFWKKHGYKGNLNQFKKIKEKIMNELFKRNEKKKLSWTNLIIEYLGIGPNNIDFNFDKYYKLTKDYYVRNAKLRKGSIELLKFLKNRNIKIILISNNLSDIANAIIDSLDIRKYFDFIIISDSIGAIKSSLKPFIIALRKSKTNPQECMMIGDKKQDMYCKKLGIKFVWLDVSANKLLAEYDYRIKKLSEIKNILK